MSNKNLGMWMIGTLIVTVCVGIAFADSDLDGFYQLAGISMFISGIWGATRLMKCEKKCDKVCK